jgi:hypothetical protein
VSGRWLQIAVCGAFTLLLSGCGDSGSGPQSGSAFVFLTVDRFGSGGVTSSLEDDDSPTVGCVTLRNNLKNPTVTATTPLDNVVVESYTVTYPIDGLGPFVFSISLIVPAGTSSGEPAQPSGNTASAAIVLIPAEAKRQPPLRPFPPLPNTTTATVVFQGRDGRGQRVSAEGALTVMFVRTGQDAVPTCT